MTNGPKKHLSNQFGAITGPSDAELSDIENNTASEAGAYFTPELIEQYRKDYAQVDPEYAASRRARDRRTGPVSTPTSATFEDLGVQMAKGLQDFARSSSSAFNAQIDLANTATDIAKAGEVPSGEGVPLFAFDEDESGRGRTYKGVGLTGFDEGPGTSSFNRFKPETQGEQAARNQGLFLLRTAGPTCNHPRCQSLRAKGMELLGRGVGTRLATKTPWEAQNPEQAIPSVRKDVKAPEVTIKPESRGKEKLVGSYNTGMSTDYGDFEVNRKKTTSVPEYTPVDSNHPAFKALQNEYRGIARGGESPFLFTPEDYLEHHHAPGEENVLSPWE